MAFAQGGFVECKYCAEKHLIEDTNKDGKCPSCGKPMDGTPPKTLIEIPTDIQEELVSTKEEEQLIAEIDNLVQKAKAARRSPNRGKIIEMVGKHLYHKGKFRTPSDIQLLYRYDTLEGIYRDDGEVFVKGQAQRIIDLTASPEMITTHVGNEVVALLKRLTYIPRDSLEPDKRYTPLANGIYDFKQNTLIPFTPDLFFTSKLVVTYDPEATCPQVDKFFSEIVVPEEKEVLYELAGYIMRRTNPFQKAWLFDGVGNNGKSTYLRLLGNLIGKENICSVPIQKLESNRFSAAELDGKYLNTVADLSGTDLKSTGTFKAIVGGDIIQAEKKGQHPFKFYPWAKMVYSCNKIPDSGEDDSNAFYRRWILITFPYDFAGREDRALDEKLAQGAELSGLLNKALAALKNVDERGAFTGQKNIEEMRKLYVSKSNSVKAFLTTVEIDVEAFLPKSQVWRAYFNYCKENHLPARTEAAFWRELKPIFDCDAKATIDGQPHVRIVKGIKIKNIELPSRVAQRGLTSEKLITVRFAKPIDCWIGSDGNKYGPFVVGDIIQLPKSETEFILKSHFGNLW